jgi:cyclophilin family peptidyl-prolyl cis-trans isomerase
MKHLFYMLLLTLFLLLATSLVGAQDEVSGTPEDICEAATPADEPETREFTEAEDVLEVGVDYHAIFCTDAGAIYIDLYESLAPLTVNNFVFLAESGYYNNIIFHRVMQDFMAQGGDPTGTGSGGPGYQFRDEFSPFMTFDRPGLLAMANAGAGTNGSQFFITTVPTPHLDFKHTIFGEVLAGQENVEGIMLRDPSVTDADATTLETVVIVTDPTLIESDYESTLEPVTADVVIAGLEVLNSPEQMPPDLLESFVAPAVSEDVPELLAENGHEYRVTTSIVNGQCNAQYFFDRLDYTVDLLDSAETVTTLLASEELGVMNEADGYTLFDTAYGVNFYRQETATDCNEEAVKVRVHSQRGPYLITLEVTASQASLDEAGRDTMIQFVVTNMPLVFEGSLAAAFRTPTP